MMPMPVSDFERRRQANIADNKRVLAALGLLDPLKDKPTLEFILNLKKRKPEDEDDCCAQPPKKRVKKAKTVLSKLNNNDDGSLGSILGPVRRSARNQGKAASKVNIGLDVEEDNNAMGNEKPRLRVTSNREKFYGPVPGIEIGTTYMTRLEFCVAGVHRPTVAGIHGGPDGAYSIALSGGYEDDIDCGEFFTYTGEGGRDLHGTTQKPKNLRTAPQSKNQTLSKGNLALSRSVETGNQVRVIRGYKSKSPYAPEKGYRYDGLYTVEKAWFTSGLSGFGVWKFAMKRCDDQPPPPWNYIEDAADEKSSKVEDPKQGKPSSKSKNTTEDTLHDTDESNGGSEWQNAQESVNSAKKYGAKDAPAVEFKAAKNGTGEEEAEAESVPKLQQEDKDNNNEPKICTKYGKEHNFKRSWQFVSNH